MRSPRLVEVAVTSRCNLRCRYCYHFDNPAVPYRDLPTEAWLAFFEEAGRCSVMNVVLSGGEPFARSDLDAIVGGIVANRMRFSVNSNGTLVDDARAAMIAGSGRCDYVQVSLDGARPETHDAVRGPGSHADAVAGIRALQRHGVSTTVRVTLHSGNIDEIDSIAVFLLEDLGLRSFSTNAAGCFGSGASAPDLALDASMRTRAMRALLAVAERYPGRLIARAGPLADARMYAEMERARASGAPVFSDGGRLTACGCPFTSLAVRSDGTYVPCSMLAHLALGRIGVDPLLAVWRDAPILGSLRRRRERRLEEFEHCRGCPYIPYCTGNCPAAAHALTGTLDHPSPDACLRDFLAGGGEL